MAADSRASFAQSATPPPTLTTHTPAHEPRHLDVTASLGLPRRRRRLISPHDFRHAVDKALLFHRVHDVADFYCAGFTTGETPFPHSRRLPPALFFITTSDDDYSFVCHADYARRISPPTAFRQIISFRRLPFRLPHLPLMPQFRQQFLAADFLPPLVNFASVIRHDGLVQLYSVSVVSADASTTHLGDRHLAISSEAWFSAATPASKFSASWTFLAPAPTFPPHCRAKRSLLSGSFLVR